MILCSFVAEDFQLVAQRDIKTPGIWTVTVSDTFDKTSQKASLDDTHFAYLIALMAAGDGIKVLELIYDELESVFNKVRPFP